MLLERTKYRKLMEEFFSQNGEEELQNWKNFIFEKDNDGKLGLVWGSVLYGRLGAEVRNWMRQQAPWIDEEFKNFGGCIKVNGKRVEVSKIKQADKLALRKIFSL